jgi:hypothetical protein
VFDALGADWHRAGDFDLFVKDSRAGRARWSVRAEPGAPAGIVIGAPILALGPGAVRFAAARTLRLAATHLDALLAASPEEAAALLVGIIRQFVPEYRHPDVRDALVDGRGRAGRRLIPRKVKPVASAFAIESAGAFDVGAPARRGARRRQRRRLLASATCRPRCGRAGRVRDARPALTLSPIVANPRRWRCCVSRSPTRTMSSPRPWRADAQRDRFSAYARRRSQPTD